MATASEIVTRAFRRLNIIRPNADPSATQADYGLNAFNEMLDSWAASGVDVTADLPIAAKYERGVVALLAQRLAPDFGLQLPPQAEIEARDGWLALQAGYITAPTADFDDSLQYLPSQRRVGAKGN